MEGTYPILMDGVLMGALEVMQRGALTVFDARCRMTAGVLRLSVYGDDGEGYLGVMMPENGELRLQRSLSRTAMAGFPKTFIEAGPAGRGSAAPERSAEESKGGKPEPVAADAEDSGETEKGTEPTEIPEQSAPPAAKEPTEEDTDHAAERETEELFWYSSPDGALVCFDGAKNLLALPEGDPRIPQGVQGEMRSIEGKRYVVVPVHSGRILR